MKKTRNVLYIIAAIFAFLIIIVSLTGIIKSWIAITILDVLACFGFAAAAIITAALRKSNGKKPIIEWILAIILILAPCWQIFNVIF